MLNKRKRLLEIAKLVEFDNCEIEDGPLEAQLRTFIWHEIDSRRKCDWDDEREFYRDILLNFDKILVDDFSI